MVAIRIKKGLDVPIEGEPTGDVEPIMINGQMVRPKKVALDLSCFGEVRFKLLVKPGDVVKLGQPLVFDKKLEERVFVSPGCGIVTEVKRGLKRRLLSIEIELNDNEERVTFDALSPTGSREQLIKRLLEGGVFPHIRQRPFDLLADSKATPRAIFVKVVESAPFTVSPEMQVVGWEKEFEAGLQALGQLTEGKVHLVHKEGCTYEPFVNASGVEVHSISGPHPSGNVSVHIHHIDPVKKLNDTVWTVDVIGVIAIGYLLLKGSYFTDRVIAVGGSGVVEGRQKFLKGRAGMPVTTLIDGRVPKGEVRFISGDPLMGHQVESDEGIGFYHTTLSVIPKRQGQEFMHFLGIGMDKFTASGTYLSGHLKGRLYPFDTNQHGERRAFVIGAPYDKVMPMRLNTMQLVKSVMAQDFDLAEILGLLEVAPEDFALPTFVCPCKIEMVDIIKDGIRGYVQEVFE